MLVASAAAWAPDRRSEFFNRSSRAWRLTLVEGTRENRGSLEFVEKFSGQRLATLEKTGDSLTLPAGARFLVTFRLERRGFFHDFILQDGHGYYAEYLASVPDQSEPGVLLSLKDQQVGPPLNQTTEEAIQRAIADAILLDDGNLTILRDDLP